MGLDCLFLSCYLATCYLATAATLIKLTAVNLENEKRNPTFMPSLLDVMQIIVGIV